MKIAQQYPNGALVLESPLFQDQRGAFLKVFNQVAIPLADFEVVQVNCVHTKEEGTLRGLHYQKGVHAEAKFFRVLYGKMQLAFVDMREDMPSYLQATTVVLEDPKMGVLVPRGFATGYCTLQPDTVVLYLSDNAYTPEAEAGVRWDDPKVGIDWAVKEPIVSDKDLQWILF